MSAQDIDREYFKKKLLNIRAAILEIEESGDEAAKTVELDQSRVGRLSRMDALQRQAMSIESKRRRNIKLQRVEGALKRITDNTYGLCLQCGDEIDVKRLEFDPTCLVCIDCAEKREK